MTLISCHLCLIKHIFATYHVSGLKGLSGVLITGNKAEKHKEKLSLNILKTILRASPAMK